MKDVIQELVLETNSLKAKIEAALRTVEEAESLEEGEVFALCLANLDDALGQIDEVATSLRSATEALDD